MTFILLFKSYKVYLSMKKILIYNSGGGLGDSIQIFPLILSLKGHFRKAKFIIWVLTKNHFNGKLKEYNISLETVDLNLKYFGFRWWHLFFCKEHISEKTFGKFDLIIDLQSKFRNSLILGRIPNSSFYSKTMNGFFSSKNKIFKRSFKKFEFISWRVILLN